MKDHIRRLPTVDYSEIVGEKREISQISLSIPLFHSSFQFIQDAKKVEYFQNVHCRGAIWTAISFLKNTDLGDKDISIFFHVEDKVFNRAKSVFDEFNVPDFYIRKMAFNKEDFPPTPNVKNVRYGKKFMCLFDEELEEVGNWVIVDSDCFPIATEDKMLLFDTLNSHSVTIHPASIEYRLIEFEREHWIHRLCDAAGLKFNEKITENKVLKQLGLAPIATDRRKTLIRPRCKTTLFAIPMVHPIVQFIIDNIGTCCEDEFLLAAFSLWSPFTNLSELIDAPVVLSPDEYEQCHSEQYFHHLIFNSEDSDPYFTRFFRDITRNIDEVSPHVKEFKNAFKT